MIYVIFIVGTILNIFNLLMNYEKTNKKAIVTTYTVSELLYIAYIIASVEYTELNIILLTGFVSIWLLSKAYLLINFIMEGKIMQFEENIERVEGIIEEEINENDINTEELKGNNTEINEEIIETEKLEETEELEELEVIEQVEEENQVFTHNDLYEEAELKANKEDIEAEERRIRRRKIALNANRIKFPTDT